MRLRLLLPLLSLTLTSVASAQWIPVGPSSTTPNFFAANSRFVFAADDDGFVYRSSDDGRTWTAVNPTLPTSSNPNGRLVGMAATDAAVAVLERAGLYRSTNDGQTWTRTGGLPTTATSPAGLVMTRSGALATNVTVSSTRRLAVSTNNGAAWTVRDSVLTGAGDALIVVGDTLVRPYTRTYRLQSGAFATECGAAFSPDLGVSWIYRPVQPDCFGAQFPGGPPGAPPGLTYAAGRLHLGSRVSSNFGQTWTDAGAASGNGIFGLAAHGTTVVACAMTDRRCGAFFHRSASGSWSAATGLPVDHILTSQPFSTGRSFLIGLSQAGAYRSDDGVTWTPSGRFAGGPMWNVTTLARHAGALVAGSSPSRLQRSYDRGKTWELDVRFIGGFGNDGPGPLFSADSVLLGGGAEGVYKSRDLKNWMRIAATPRSTHAFFRAGGRTYLAATDGLYTTPDGGTTWTQVLGHNLNQVMWGVAGDRVIVEGGNGSVRSARWSLDGGQTWAAASRGALAASTTRQAFFVASTNFDVFGGGTFERSMDGGQTWTNIKPMLGETVTPWLLKNYGDTLLAIGPTYLAGSTDHGATWRKVLHTSPGFAFSAPSAILRVQDTVYVAFQFNGIWKRSLADLGLATAAASAPETERLALTVSPNPSAGAVRLRFTLAQPGRVRLAVYDALGREVAVVRDAEHPAGPHEVVWAGAGLAPGVYIVRIETAQGVRARPLVRVP
jgi:hypothetical protein